MREPRWLVLAPGTVKQLAPAIAKWGRDRWKVVEGKHGYVAIVEDEPNPGAEEKVALALSKTAQKKRVYAIAIDNGEAPSHVLAFEGGKKSAT